MIGIEKIQQLAQKESQEGFKFTLFNEWEQVCKEVKKKKRTFE